MLVVLRGIIGGRRSKSEIGVVWCVRESEENIRFGRVELMASEEQTKKVYESEVEGRKWKGRLRIRWRDGLEEYMIEMGIMRKEGLLLNEESRN